MYPDIVTSPGKDFSDTITGSPATTSATLSTALDISTVMKVSQIISSEIMLDRLLQKIMHLSIANAGAQRGYLILNTDDELTIEASEDADKNESQVMQSMPLKECPDICHAIVNYVHHSGKDVVLGNAAAGRPFYGRPVHHAHKVQIHSVHSHYEQGHAIGHSLYGEQSECGCLYP